MLGNTNNTKRVFSLCGLWLVDFMVTKSFLSLDMTNNFFHALKASQSSPSASCIITEI